MQKRRGNPENTVLEQCMGLKKGESLLVVADKNTLKIGQAILYEARKICKDAQISIIPVGNVSAS